MSKVEVLKSYEDGKGGYSVIKYVTDVNSGKHSELSVSDKKNIFSEMLKKNAAKKIFVGKSVALFESSIFALGISCFNSIEKIDGFFSKNKREKKCGHCAGTEDVANFCMKTGIRKDTSNEAFDSEFMLIAEDAGWAIRFSDTGVYYACKKCFRSILTLAYINVNGAEFQAAADFGIKEQDKGCAVEENKTKEFKMSEKFVRVNGVVTSVDGQLAIQKDGVAYVMGEAGVLTPVAANPTTDARAYANIRVLLKDLKAKDLVIDPVTKVPMFVENVAGNRVTMRDVISATSFVRDFVPDEITGEATVTVLISVIKMIRTNSDVLPLINRYGKERVFDVIVNQYLSYGNVDAKRIEAELNPVVVQLAMTNALQDMTTKVGGLVDRLGERE